MSVSQPSVVPHQRGNVWFVLVAVFIDMVGIGIAIPVLPVLIGAYTANREMQAYWSMALLAAYGLMQFLCAPMLGAISDRFGRLDQATLVQDLCSPMQRQIDGVKRELVGMQRAGAPGEIATMVGLVIVHGWTSCPLNGLGCIPLEPDNRKRFCKRGR
jgi:MFS family permease